MEGKKQIPKRRMSVQPPPVNKELLMPPLLKGWVREVVSRTNFKDGKHRKRKDVYYFSPSGTKFRSSKQVEKYLIEDSSEFTPQNFNFSQIVIGLGEPYEVLRSAAFRPPKPENSSSQMNLSSKCPSKEKPLFKVKLFSKKPLKAKPPSIKCMQLADTSRPPSKMRDEDNCGGEEESMKADTDSEKRILHLEELCEEEEIPQSSKLTNLTVKEDYIKSRLPLFQSMESNESPSSFDNHLKIPLTKPSQILPVKSVRKTKPQIPVIQLFLDDSPRISDEEKRTLKESQCEDSSCGLSSSCSEGSATSRIRVRSLAELCYTDSSDSNGARDACCAGPRLPPLHYMQTESQSVPNHCPLTQMTIPCSNNVYIKYPPFSSINYRRDQAAAPLSLSASKAFESSPLEITLQKEKANPGQVTLMPSYGLSSAGCFMRSSLPSLKNTLVQGNNGGRFVTTLSTPQRMCGRKGASFGFTVKNDRFPSPFIVNVDGKRSFPQPTSNNIRSWVRKGAASESSPLPHLKMDSVRTSVCKRKETGSKPSSRLGFRSKGGRLPSPRSISAPLVKVRSISNAEWKNFEDISTENNG